jgi:hypothetical protein
MGKLLIILGIVLVIVGTIITYSDRIPFLGKMPGDITIEKENFKFYFPITTSILLSILLSIVFYLINRFRH